MPLLIKTFCRTSINLCQIVKYSVNVTDTTDTFVFKSNFTADEQAKILRILNGSSPDQLSKFSVSQSRIKNLVSWKNKKGPFRTLSDVLEVEGLGEKVLEKICEKIVTENVVEEVKDLKANNTINKRLKQLVTPCLNGNVANNIQSAVGVHLGPTGISWAKLSRNQNKLTSWNYEDLSLLPQKMFPTDTFDLAIKTFRKLPTGDVYILEANPSMSPQSSTQSAAVSSYAQQLELSSMLLALINTSIQHNTSLQKINADRDQQELIENRVFHLKSKTPARLFRTLLGTEVVAAITTVIKLVENDSESKDFSLPCTPITLDQQLRYTFINQTSANKELLGQALMLVVSFMDLCIYKNPVSLAAISPHRRK